MDLGRTERFHQESEKATFDISNVKSRDPRDVDFSGAWGQGIKMNWAYVPKEDQKTHINWRQSINDDGKDMKRLASFPCSYANGGGNAVGNKAMSGNGGTGGMMPRQKEAMDAFSGEKGPLSKKVAELISNGKGFEGQKADLLNLYREEAEKTHRQKATEASLDPLLMTCIGYAAGEKDFDTLMTKYQDLKTKIGTDNPAVLVSAYGTSENVFLGTRGSTDNEGKPVDGNKLPQDGIPRFDQPFPSTTNNNTNSGGSSGSGSEGNSEETDEDSPVKVNWADIDSWLWAEFAPRFVNRAEKLGFSSKDMDLFPKVCYLYCVVIPELKNSRYDSDEYAFPFTDEEIALGMRYSGRFGEQRDGGSRIHRGIDIGADRGIKIHAIADGTVTAAGDGWGEACNAVNIQHANGVYSRYLHCNEVLVSTGQQVTKGQEVATVGGTGSDGPDTYDDHLHLEICHGESEVTPSNEDPASFFPLFESEVPYGEWLKTSI